MLCDPLRYRVDVAARDQTVDEAISSLCDFVVAETHPAEVRLIGGHRPHEVERSACDLARTRRVGFEDDELLDHERCLIAEAGARIGRVFGSNQHGQRAGSASVDEVEHARSERREYASWRRHRI